MAQINIRIDDDLKNSAETLFSDLGLNISTAITMFIRQAVRQGSIPFEVTTRVDPFWSENNQAHLRKVIAEYESGKSKRINKTMEELEAMENG
jgi:DNA-damage-inducible protein J